MARIVTIERSRLPRWLENFAGRHGDLAATMQDSALLVAAPDGAEARLRTPFLPHDPPPESDPATTFVDHVLTDRTIGALLVRRGGYAVGVFSGTRLIRHKVGSSHVQGRTKAGGWSQQRYARRRGNQARQVYERAAAAAEMILLPVRDELVAVATGGDRAGVEAVLDFPSLQGVHALAVPRIYPTEDPRLKVLEAFPEQFLAIEIELNDLA